MDSTSTGAPLYAIVSIKSLKYAAKLAYCDGITEPPLTRLLLSFIEAGGVHGVARILAPRCFAFWPSRIALVQFPSGEIRRRMSVSPIWLDAAPYRASISASVS